VAVAKNALRTAFEERKVQYERANDQIKQTLKSFLDDLSKRYGLREGLQVLGEPKGFESFYKKATKKYHCKTVEEAFERVHDLSRVRVLCHTLSDCYSLLDMLRQQNHLLVDETSIEDFIKNPSETGYRAIHLQVRVDVPFDGETVGVLVEVQIRTILEEAWGFYTHGDFYKGENVPPVIADLMREFSTLLYWADCHADLLIDEVAGKRDEPDPGIEAAHAASR
jgi:GTP pyrophosphokinase